MAGKIHLTYEEFRDALEGERLPAAIVNLDALDHNTEVMLDPVRPSGKTVRIATKSVRCPWIVNHILTGGNSGLFRGLMNFTMEEAAYLAQEGYDDLLVVYPTVQSSDMELMAKLAADDVRVTMVIDSEEHLDVMGRAGRAARVELRAAIELDVALERAGGRLYFGVRRSPVRDGRRVIELIRYAERIGGVRIVGIMAYEAQVAGLNDTSPYTRMLNPLKRWIKKASVPKVLEHRAEVWRALEREGIELEFINGGGTGSVKSTSADPAVTEVTVGSGFYTSHLFVYYRDLPLVPAAFFAIQVVRRPKPGMITCQGGGYIASGQAGFDRLPMPYSPQGLKMLGFEGAGEVQTPLLVPPGCPHLEIGDPVIWQHSKAGELMERFNEVLIIRNGKITDRVPTYRGLGKSFL